MDSEPQSSPHGHTRDSECFHVIFFSNSSEENHSHLYLGKEVKAWSCHFTCPRSVTK